MNRPWPRAIVLDFDGVILESNDLKRECFREVFARFPDHASAMMAYHDRHVSLSRYDKFRHLVEDRLGRAGDHELIQSLATQFSDTTLARLRECPFVAGALDFLKEFGASYPLFLISMTPEPDLQQVLATRQLESMFAGVWGCPPWTKASALDVVIERMACDPADLVFVGDSEGDRAVAALKGLWFVARLSGLPFDVPPTRAARDMYGVAEIVRAPITT